MVPFMAIHVGDTTIILFYKTLWWQWDFMHRRARNALKQITFSEESTVIYGIISVFQRNIAILFM